MADDGLPVRADEQKHNAPPSEQGDRDPENAVVAPDNVEPDHVAPDSIAPTAPETAMSDDVQDAIRTVFVARTTEASAADFSHLQDSEDGAALRGAYLAHLADTDATVAAGDGMFGGNVLRDAYLAHAAVDREMDRRRRRKSPSVARRKPGGAGRRRKSTKAAAKRTARQPVGSSAKAMTGAGHRRPRKAKASVGTGTPPAPHMGRGRAKAGPARRRKRTR